MPVARLCISSRQARYPCPLQEIAEAATGIGACTERALAKARTIVRAATAITAADPLNCVATKQAHMALALQLDAYTQLVSALEHAEEALADPTAAAPAQRAARDDAEKQVCVSCLVALGLRPARHERKHQQKVRRQLSQGLLAKHNETSTNPLFMWRHLYLASLQHLSQTLAC